MPRYISTPFGQAEQNGPEMFLDSAEFSTPSLHRQSSYGTPVPPLSSARKSRQKQRTQTYQTHMSPQSDTPLPHTRPGFSPRNTDLYSEFVRRYREHPNSLFDSTSDLESYNQPQDDFSDDDRPGSAQGDNIHERFASPSFDVDSYEPVTEAEKERLEWQSMLASVLDGEVLKTEKSRIHDALASFESSNSKRLAEIWIGLRAKLRSREVNDEKQRLEERKMHSVDRVIKETILFCIPDGTNVATASLLVDRLLRQLDKIESFYPTLKAFHMDKPLADTKEFRDRRDALYTWSNVRNALHLQISLLQRWTGSDSLDVSYSPTKPDREGSTFLEQILKEGTVQRTFERGALVTMHKLIATARDARVNLAEILAQMNLPIFEEELVRLIGFPTRLVYACLKVRLESVGHFTSLELLTIDQMLDDFRLTIGLACTLKRQYNEFMLLDLGGHWNIPHSIPEDYDLVLLEALNYFFKLIHQKINAGSKDIHFKDTEVLRVHEATFNDVSVSVKGGASVVAEQLCTITHKMISKANTTLERQIRIPILAKEKTTNTPFTSPHAASSPANGTTVGFDFRNQHAGVKGRVMSGSQMIAWYERIFESVKTRYRKLATYSRSLIQNFGNASEYSLENVQMDAFIGVLVQTDHFLIYTQSYEEEGTYIIGSRGLKDSPDIIAQLIQDPFHVNSLWEGRHQFHSKGESEDEFDPADEDNCAYLLVISPRVRFYWNGPVLMLQLPCIELDLKDNIVRLVADGSQSRLTLAKERFADCFIITEDDAETLEPQQSTPTCIIDQMAHLPNVNRELWNIARRTDRLAEAIVEAVFHIRRSLNGAPNCTELLYNWYSFATEHGQQAQKYMSRPSWLRYNQILIRLAISWVTFVCDDCDPSDRRTFKWAISALEFASLRTQRSNILQLPDDEFDLLRQKVATCMQLLMQHFDILGVKATTAATDAKRERMKMDELRRMGLDDIEDKGELLDFQTPASEGTAVSAAYYPSDTTTAPTDRSIRRFREDVIHKLSEVDEKRACRITEQKIVGRVLDRQKPEDQSLMELAASASTVQIRWNKGEFVGAGAFGSVYKAVNMDTHSIMAVKEIMVLEMSGSPNLYKQIQDELKVMEMLHHPNIVEFYGIEVHRDRVYIFEEFCGGGSLASFLEVGRIADEHVLQVYTMQMLEGLVYLHARGIVHRDVKPDNILLDHRGVLKFVDFGAAKVIAKASKTRVGNRTARHQESTPPLDISLNINNPVGAQENGLIRQNSLTGTPMYMSPEVIKNDTKANFGAMDIWSLGCVVLECATGRKPWSNLDNEWAIMFHIGVATQHPPLPDKSELSETGIDFIRQCLIIDAMKRPSAEDLIRHRWIAEFMELCNLGGYEDEELATSPPPDIPGELDFTGATIAHQAAILREKEMETIASSPVLTPVDVEEIKI